MSEPAPQRIPLHPAHVSLSSDFYNERPLQKVVRKLKEEPLVPIGCLLTVAAFTNAYLAMRKGDHARVQTFFRARVAAQGFTVLAMVAGGFYYQADRHRQKELWKLKREREAEEKRQKWIRELEIRDEEDRAVKALMEKRRRKVEGGRDDEKEDKKERQGSVLDQVQAAQARREEKGSWGAWLGGKAKEPDRTGVVEEKEAKK
jgi:hypothetical protein